MYGKIMLSEFRQSTGSSRSNLHAKSLLPLHAMITSAGIERQTGSEYDWNGLKRGGAEFVTLQYTYGGEGQLSYEGKTYAVKPGTAMLLYFPHNNRYWLPKEKQWEFFHLTLNGSEIVRIWRTVVGASGPLVALDWDNPVIQAAASAVLKVVKGEIESRWEASALAYDVAMKLLAATLPPEEDSEPRIRSASIGKAMDYCRENISGSIGVDDLAGIAGYSRYHFSRKFKESEGMTPGEFIQRERLRLAVRFLQGSNDPVDAIAAQCGFSDANYFCKVFRKAYGVPPGVFRRSGMY